MEDLKRYGGDLKLEATELRLGLPGSEETKKKISESVLKNNKRSSEATAPQEKVRVVGWPPIRSFRKNSFHGKKAEIEEQGTFVKVSMDGAPYLRKIDLRLYKGYSDLLMALKDMFKCFNLEDKHGSEYATTYEDKDGDLMLVGDVPWEMFISSCKRLRIMKEHEIRGLDCGD